MKLKKVLLVCLIPAFVISGCGKTTKDETGNITKQETTAEESAQDEQETGNTETEASGKDPNEKTEEASRDLFAMDMGSMLRRQLTRRQREWKLWMPFSPPEMRTVRSIS